MERAAQLQIIVTLTLLVVPAFCQQTHDMTMFFTSNAAEYDNHEITLRHPLPSWISGLYIRNGCGMFEKGGDSVISALDGFAKLHSFRLMGNKTVLFSAKFLMSHFFNSTQSAGHMTSYLTLAGRQPRINVIQRLESLAHGPDNTNVIVHRFGTVGSEQYVSVSDYWAIYEIDPISLSTTRRVSAPLPHPTQILHLATVPSCSHALQEDGKETFVNLYSILTPFRNSINVMRIHSADTRSLVASIPRHHVPYMHSFGLTTHYAVVFAHPLIIDLELLLETARPLESLRWDSEASMDIYVVNLDSGEVLSLQSTALFVMHNVNGFEERNTIVIDMITYPNDDFIQTMTIDRLRQGLFPIFTPSITRYRIDMIAGSVHMDTFKGGSPISNHIDLPIINPNYIFRTHCYIYGISTRNNSEPSTNVSVYLAKKDICREPSKDRFWYRPHHIPTEPHFFPSPNSAVEDDGILMSLTLDSERNLTYILFLNARSMKKINYGYLPTWMPLSFHGTFFPGI